MKTSNYLLIILIFFTAISFEACKPKPKGCCIDFNTTPFTPGIIYNVYNDSIFAECGFTVRTDSLFINGNSYFNFARIENAKPIFGSGNILNTNNVTMHFFNTSAGNPIVATFDYLDMGGRENLSVNNVLHSGEVNAVPASLGGVTINVTSTPIPLPAIGKKGTVTLSGVIKEFKIGGQEFYLDNFCFK